MPIKGGLSQPGRTLGIIHPCLTGRVRRPRAGQGACAEQEFEALSPRRGSVRAWGGGGAVFLAGELQVRGGEGDRGAQRRFSDSQPSPHLAGSVVGFPVLSWSSVIAT